MTTDSSLDFSIKNVPASWRDASSEAPEEDLTPFNRKRGKAVIPVGHQVDLATALIAAFALTASTGATWYIFETRDVTRSPLLAIVMGLFIAIAVRLGGGKAEPEIRATIAAVFYLLGMLIAVYFIERHFFQLTFGFTPDLANSQASLTRKRLTDPWTMVCWAAGLVLAMQVSFWTGPRRRRR